MRFVVIWRGPLLIISRLLSFHVGCCQVLRWLPVDQSGFDARQAGTVVPVAENLLLVVEISPVPGVLVEQEPCIRAEVIVIADPFVEGSDRCGEVDSPPLCAISAAISW
jgi:hypothetical protein